MSLFVKGSNFEPAPAGPTAAVCIDVVDLGTVDTAFGARSRIRLVWSIDKRMKGERGKPGRPYIVQKTYGRSLHPKAQLRQDLEAWAGRALTQKQVKDGIDLEKLIGKGAFLSIQHHEREGNTYANVVAIMPLPEGMPCPAADPEYIRKQDRPIAPDRGNGSEPPVPGDDDAPPPNDDPNIPF